MTLWLVSAIALASTEISAPTHDWNGLTLGATTPAQVEAWVADRGLTCPEAPSPRRTTVHYTCAAPNPAAVGQAGDPGTLEQVLLARLDDGPIHYASTDRVFASPAEGGAAYVAAQKRLLARLGPARASDAPPTTLDGPLVHAMTTWRFADLAVDLTLMRIGSGPLRLTERWSVPGVEETATTRPGSVSAHGAGVPKAAKNPHLAD